MASVLGKRARDFESTQGEKEQYVQTATVHVNADANLSIVESLCISSRVKRRNFGRAINDENADPTTSLRQVQDIYHDVFLDQDSPVPSIPGKHSKSRLTSTKRKSSSANEAVHGRGNSSSAQGRAFITVPRQSSNFSREDGDQLLTPQTPRHRDALSKKVPITPRHRISIVGKPSTPRTPRTPQTPSNILTVYNSARQLFSKSVDPGRVIGRDKERKELQELLEASFSIRSGRCVYISGPPGTGKSALVSEIALGIRRKEDVKTAHINCMSVRSSGDIYSKLAIEILDDDGFMEGDAVTELRSKFISKKKSDDLTYVVTLDEIDHLLTLDLDALYTLFEWSLHRHSKLIVIGIANALDLTDRFLPRLKARNLTPQLLPFLPYTASQIASIITTKLRSLIPRDNKEQSDFVPFIQPAAIQLCSKKVASQTGDLRKAFDIIRCTINLVEAETRVKCEANATSRLLQCSPSKTPLAENPNLASSPSKPPAPRSQTLGDFTPLTAPRATIAHVSRASAAALNHGTLQRLQTLNLQQRAALCALIYHQKSSRKALNSVISTPSKKSNTCPTVKALHGTYVNLCKHKNAMNPLTATEFSDVISGLETLGLVGEENEHRSSTKIPTPRRGRSEERRILSFVNEEEVQGCLDGIGGSILEGLLQSDNE